MGDQDKPNGHWLTRMWA